MLSKVGRFCQTTVPKEVSIDSMPQQSSLIVLPTLNPFNIRLNRVWDNLRLINCKVFKKNLEPPPQINTQKFKNIGL